MTRVAVASRSFSRHPVLRAELPARYDDVTFNDKGVIFAGDELIAFLEGHEKAIVGLERLDEAVFSALPELKGKRHRRRQRSPAQARRPARDAYP